MAISFNVIMTDELGMELESLRIEYFDSYGDQLTRSELLIALARLAIRRRSKRLVIQTLREIIENKEKTKKNLNNKSNHIAVQNDNI